jgi:hypothetical protein
MCGTYTAHHLRVIECHLFLCTYTRIFVVHYTYTEYVYTVFFWFYRAHIIMYTTEQALFFFFTTRRYNLDTTEKRAVSDFHCG